MNVSGLRVDFCLSVVFCQRLTQILTWMTLRTSVGSVPSKRGPHTSMLTPVIGD